MSNGYGQIAFTDDVQAQQERFGSRRFYARHQARHATTGGPDAVTDEVRAYLADRDSFYLATVSETGWPYVQYRGGPQGFLKVLTDRTIGWADFRGNLQYISSGNVHANDRVALIVLSYPTRERLKIYGHATVKYANEDPDALAGLVDDRYDAVVEHAVLITVEAFDWNCQQHITLRYTLAELETRLRPERQRLAELEAENVELRRRLAAAT